MNISGLLIFGRVRLWAAIAGFCNQSYILDILLIMRKMHLSDTIWGGKGQLEGYITVQVRGAEWQGIGEEDMDFETYIPRRQKQAGTN